MEQNNFETLFNAALKDIKTDLHDEFDKNFQRKAFFDKSWQEAKHDFRKGSLLVRNGNLRRGLQSRVEGDKIIFTNTQIYADIHNKGGTITVTPKRKKFFWAMYYAAMGKMTTKKDGTRGNSKGNINLNADAAYWKSLALMKVGARITIPQRQFVGWHPVVKEIVKGHFDKHFTVIAEEVKKMLKA